MLSLFLITNRSRPPNTIAPNCWAYQEASAERYPGYSKKMHPWGDDCPGHVLFKPTSIGDWRDTIKREEKKNPLRMFFNLKVDVIILMFSLPFSLIFNFKTYVSSSPFLQSFIQAIIVNVLVSVCEGTVLIC